MIDLAAPKFVTWLVTQMNERPHIVGFIVVGTLLVLWLVADPEPDRCPERRAGCRCVHDENHRGSHRDEFGDYWN